MPVLSKTDEAKLLLRVLECSPQSEAWPRVLQVIDSALGCRSFLSEFDLNGKPLQPFGGEQAARSLGSVLSDIKTENGWTALQFLLNEASLHYPYCKTSLDHDRLETAAAQITQSEEASHSQFGQEFRLRRAPGLISPVWRTDRSTILFGCLFTEHQPDSIDVAVASETFRTIVRALSPGLNVHFQLEKQRSDGRLQRALLSALERSAVLIDADRAILAQTASGLGALSELDAGVKRRDKLVLKNKQLEAAFQELLTEIHKQTGEQQRSGLPLTLPGSELVSKSVCFRDADGWFRRVVIEPVQANAPGIEGGRQPWFLIRVSDAADLPQDLESVLQDHFDLSQSEAHLARHLTMSGSLDDTVQHLGITKNTAKTHLRRIYDKTGARTQLQLARLVHRLAGLF